MRLYVTRSCFDLWISHSGWKREDCAISEASLVSLLSSTKPMHTYEYLPSRNHDRRQLAHAAEGGRTSKANSGILLPYNVTRPLLPGMARGQTKTAGRLWWAEWKCVSVWVLLHQLTVTSVHSLHLHKSLHYSIPHARQTEKHNGQDVSSTKAEILHKYIKDMGKTAIKKESFSSNIITPRTEGIRRSCVIISVLPSVSKSHTLWHTYMHNG